MKVFQIATLLVVGAVFAAGEQCDWGKKKCADQSRCIPEDWFCDGLKDCADGSDEAGCPGGGCDTNQFFCKDDNKCVMKIRVCDGIKDCNDASDEANCTTTPLPPVGECGIKGQGSRIINGVDAGLGEFPWQISLRYGYYGHICGGTIISKNWILCAAHCFGSSKNPKSYKVRVGEWHLKTEDGTEKDFEVEELHVHDSFSSPQQFQNDIALLKLKEPIDFAGPYAGPACMPKATDDYRGHEHCFLSGWGLVKRYPQTLADQLQKVEGKIWTQEDLRGQYGSFLPPNVVGFGEPYKWSACMGDSGGPLICKNLQGFYDVIGVVSFGPGTCEGRPGVFTDVAAFRSWITDRTGEIFGKPTL